MSDVPLVDREALARWKEDWNMPLECGPDYEFADDLIASGILRPMPTRSELTRIIVEHCDTKGTQYAIGAATAADAILALVKGDKP